MNAVVGYGGIVALAVFVVVYVCHIASDYRRKRRAKKAGWKITTGNVLGCDFISYGEPTEEYQRCERISDRWLAATIIAFSIFGGFAGTAIMIAMER